MKKYILVDVLIFIVVSVYGTISAAIVDAGSWTNANPLHEAGHAMTLRESIIHNIPLGISEGLVVAALLLFFVFVGKKVYEEVQECRDEQ